MTARSRRCARALLASAAGLALAACGSFGTGGIPAGVPGAAAGKPITIGISLPLSKDFAADGEASLKGYQLWASDVNAHGGLLGRPVKLIWRDDKSDPKIAAQDYTTLITRDHVDLVLAPFSSLLTAAVAPVTGKLGYPLVAGSAGADSVYALRSHSLFSTTVPVSIQLLPFVDWVLSRPAGQRPATAAYPMVDDPFADPPVQNAARQLSANGIKTVLEKIYPATSTPGQLARDAAAIVALHPDMVVLGSVDVPTVSAFINTFAKDGYNPKILIATAGPDQGQAFLNGVGNANATGVMVPNGWYGEFPDALSHLMVQDYIAKYGGTASDVNADVAEAYSAGEVLADAVSGVGSLNRPAIISWLHSHEVQTVVGPVKFDAIGKNLDTAQSALIFQWQAGGHFVQVLPDNSTGVTQPLIPKPAWGG